MTQILLVENSVVDHQLVAGLIHRINDWSLTSVPSTEEAIAQLSRSTPDVVLTCLEMARAQDHQLIREIRRKHQGTPIVLLTSDGNHVFVTEALRLGATSFSPKSRRPKDLVRTIRHVTEMAAYMRYTHDTNFMPIPERVAFVLENDLSLIGPLIEHLQSSLPHWSDRDRLQIGMAMDEALVNAMHHGNLEVCSSLRDVADGDEAYYDEVKNRKEQPRFQQRRVRLEAEFSDQHICVQISDEGPGFDPAQVPDPRAEENLQKLSGRGLFLIRSFMDQVAHNMTGNQITMTKLRREA